MLPSIPILEKRPDPFSSPRASLASQTIVELRLYNRFRVQVVGVWRDGKSLRSGLSMMKIEHGDGLLIVGPRSKLAKLKQEPNLIVLNPVQAKPINLTKAPLAGGLMLLVVLAVLV